MLESIRHSFVPFVLIVSMLGRSTAAEAQTWMAVPTNPGGFATSAYPLAVFDEANDRAMTFGGIPHSADVWVLEHPDAFGGPPTWTRLTPIGGPPTPRHAHGIAYDQLSNRLMVFGGCAGGCLPTLNDVWVLTNANGLGGVAEWTQLSPTGPAPTGRAHAAVAYDPTTNTLMVFGGQDGGGFGGATFAEMWILTHANGLGGAPAWLRLATEGTFPPGQYGATASYDAVTNRLTVVGGGAHGTGNPTNAAWVLQHANGTGGTPTWSNLVPEGAAGAPPARAFSRAARDEVNNRIQVVGFSADDVWTLDGANGLGTVAWTHVIGSGTPPATPIGLIAFTPSSGRLTVFGPSSESVWILGESEPVNRPPSADAGMDQTVEATSSAGALVTLDGSASMDPDGDPLTFAWSGPFGTLTGTTIAEQFPLGSWIVTLTVSDGRGGTTTDHVAVNVIDSTPPEVRLTLSVDTLWAPNNKLIPVTVFPDVVDQAGTAVCSVSGVSSNEPPAGDEPDWEITSALRVSLRAARDGQGSGRTYSITVGCTDEAGNAATGIVNVFVPHDRR